MKLTAFKITQLTRIQGLIFCLCSHAKFREQTLESIWVEDPNLQLQIPSTENQEGFCCSCYRNIFALSSVKPYNEWCTFPAL